MKQGEVIKYCLSCGFPNVPANIIKDSVKSIHECPNCKTRYKILYYLQTPIEISALLTTQNGYFFVEEVPLDCLKKKVLLAADKLISVGEEK